MGNYKISFARSARKDLQSLQKRNAERILSKFEELKNNPRPQGCKKLKHTSPLRRLRVGEYRVVYSIDDEEKSIAVLVVRHRSDAYR